MPHYDSDDSSRVTEDRRLRRDRKPRRPSPSSDGGRSRRSSYTDGRKDEKKGSSGFETAGKAAIVIGLVQVIKKVYEMWKDEKDKEKDKEYERRRRKDFERSKAARRRAEQERDRGQDSSDEDYSRVSHARKIEYAPSTVRSRSTSRAPRRIEPPRSRSVRSSRKDSRRRSSSTLDDDDYERDRRGASRAR